MARFMKYPDRKKKDAKRDTYLRSLGHTVLRFTNARVFEDTEGVLRRNRCPISPLPMGEGLGVRVNNAVRVTATPCCS